MGSEKTWLKISGLCGLLAPVVAFTCIALAIYSYPPFSWTDNALSDLGVQSGITAPVFNIGLIVSGVLALIFASSLHVFLQAKALGTVGTAIFVVDTLALAAIGVFPENVKPTHYIVSVMFFLLYPLAMLVITAALLLVGRKRMGLFTLLTALAAAATWIFHWTVGFGSNVAIPETLSAIVASLWAMVVGFKMLKASSRANKPQQ